MKFFLVLWAIAAVFMLGWYLKVESTCDGIVKDNWYGIPSCYAEGNTHGK